MITVNDNSIRATMRVIDILTKDMDAVQDWPEYTNNAMIRDSFMVGVYAKTTRQRLWNFIDQLNRHNTLVAMSAAGVSGRR